MIYEERKLTANLSSCCKLFRLQRDRRNPHCTNCSLMFMIPFPPTFVSRRNHCERRSRTIPVTTHRTYQFSRDQAQLPVRGRILSLVYLYCMYLVKLCAQALQAVSLSSSLVKFACPVRNLNL